MKISKSSTILKFVIFLAATTILPVFIMTGNVFAAVGNGGSGGASGSGPEAHWTNRGWGWAVYQTSGPGPQEPNFRNGYPWTSAKAQCQSENANTVTMHIIYDSYGKGMVYDYKSAQDGPPMYSAHFAAGSLVDGGRATAIDTPDARARFDALPAGERAGFTFGNNVGWFCTDRGPSESPNASCAITSYPSSVTVGQSFSATFSISNTGNTVWSVDPSVSDRFKLGSASPRDNNTWGSTRKEIAGVASGFGYVVYDGTSTTTWPDPATFTAPSTPGTYTFAWQVLREGVAWYGSACSVPITVNGSPQADCPAPWNDPIRVQPLPNQGAPSGNGHTEVVSYTNESQVISVADEWGEATTYTDTRNNSVTLDYTPHINNYPYDFHTPTVRYTVNYKIDYYDHHEHPYDCSYTRPNGTRVNQTCYSHEDHYTGTSYGTTGTQTQNGPTMSPCWNRNFNLDPAPRSNGAAWRDFDEEEPSWVSFGSHVDVRFSLPERQTGLRRPMRLNYSANATYWIDRNGAVIPYSQPRYSGPGCTNRFPGNETIGDTYSPATLGEDYLDCFQATIPPLQAGDRACFRVNFTYDRGQINTEGNIVSSSGSTQTGEPRCSEPIVDRPYFRVFGGDVMAGTSAFGTCTPGVGTINAFNRGSRGANAFYGNSPYGGAGTQLAAFATSSITEFVSAATRGVSPVVPKGLTFANTAATYGGNWDSSNVPCQEDYFQHSTGPDPGLSRNISGDNGAFSRTGNMTITGGSVPQGRRIAIYVDGDVAITGNIQFVSAYNGVSNIPSVRIIARNIYIAPGVTNVDAVLIAQPSGAGGGGIITCSDGSFGMPAASQLISTGAGGCRNRLTIFGALLAREIRFMRSQGSIRNSNNGHNSSNPSIAESIIFSPEVWLANAAVIPPEREPYEAFTSLPPIL